VCLPKAKGEHTGSPLQTVKKAESQLLAIHGTAALVHPWTSASLCQNPIQSTYIMYASIMGFCQTLLFDFFARSGKF